MPSLPLLSYALASYLAFLATFLYLVGFLGGLPLPQTIDGGGPAAGAMVERVAIDLGLVALFGIQHSVMARAWFKRAWTRVVPPAAERSTYVLASTLVLAVLLWQWRPIASPVVWNVTGSPALVIQGLFWLGWSLALSSTFMIDHFEMFGLRQVWESSTAQDAGPPAFRKPLLYRFVRHPLYLGFLLALWATPRMTAGHLLFAAGFTAYILIGIRFEERDLIARFGARYASYRRDVGMLLPRSWRSGARPVK
jgi:protein-S-isoprenylcysteine O-methyltransferase Ste14